MPLSSPPPFSELFNSLLSSVPFHPPLFLPYSCHLLTSLLPSSSSHSFFSRLLLFLLFTFSHPLLLIILFCPLVCPLIFSSPPVFSPPSSPYGDHLSLPAPYPIISPLLSSSPPLSISAITQFSCVFPFQILSPCITSEFLLGVPVGYLCALFSICARSFLLPPHAQIAAKGSGINIQALQAFGAGDIW